MNERDWLIWMTLRDMFRAVTDNNDEIKELVLCLGPSGNSAHGYIAYGAHRISCSKAAEQLCSRGLYRAEDFQRWVKELPHHWDQINKAAEKLGITLKQEESA